MDLCIDCQTNQASATYEEYTVAWDAHRQRIVNWINATGGTSSAFDVTTKGILHSALHNEYWRLKDHQGKPTGVLGWLTFLENQDTGSLRIEDPELQKSGKSTPFIGSISLEEHN